MFITLYISFNNMPLDTRATCKTSIFKIIENTSMKKAVFITLNITCIYKKQSTNDVMYFHQKKIHHKNNA